MKKITIDKVVLRSLKASCPALSTIEVGTGCGFGNLIVAEDVNDYPFVNVSKFGRENNVFK